MFHPPSALVPIAGKLAVVAEGSGIYFLVKDGILVYIGKSVRIKGRISDHRHGKDFDLAHFLAVSSERLSEYEGALIRHFRPPLNKVVGTPRESDAQILFALGIDATKPPAPAVATKQPEPAEIEEDEDEDEASYWPWCDSPLVEICVRILYEDLYYEHRCPEQESESDCHCPVERKKGGVVNSVVECSSYWGVDELDEVADAYTKDCVVYVTWKKSISSRFYYNKFVDRLMDLLDINGPWAVVIRREDDVPDRYWTTDREVFDPDGDYEPPMERLVNAAREAMAKRPELFDKVFGVTPAIQKGDDVPAV